MTDNLKFSGLCRRSRLDRGRRLDCWRIALPGVVRRYVVEAASQSEHCARHRDDGGVHHSGEMSAAILSFCSGFAAMVATVATVTLVADYCPPRSEGFTFALMNSNKYDLSTWFSGTFGAFLFDHVFHHSLALLILSSAAYRLRVCARAVPASRQQAAGALGRGDGRPGVNCTAFILGHVLGGAVLACRIDDEGQGPERAGRGGKRSSRRSPSGSPTALPHW